jgi:hypothetical protein
MANVSAPKGFVPVRHLNGSAWNGAVVPYLVLAADGTAIFKGDLVQLEGTAGPAGLVVAGYDCEGMMSVEQATPGTAGQDLIGVVVGFAPDPTNLMNKHRAASTNRVAYVVVDPTVVYEIQEDAVGSALSATEIGLAMTFTTTAGSATTGVSAMALDSSEQSNTATFPLKLIGLSKKVGNAFNTAGAGSDPATFDVVLNTGFFMPNIAGV